MNKRDLAIIVALFALWISWPIIDRQIIKKKFYPHSETPVEVVSDETDAATAEPAMSSGTPSAPTTEPQLAAPTTAPEVVEKAIEPTEPEETAIIENEKVRVKLSSHGATVKSAELMDYTETIDPESPPVLLDFSVAPALAYLGLEGLGSTDGFSLNIDSETQTAVLERKNEAGLRFRRHITLGEHYQLKVTDELINESKQDIALAQYQIQTGSMRNSDGKPKRGVTFMGIDVLGSGADKVKHWGSKIPKWFKEVAKEKGLPKLPVSIVWPLDTPVDWVAAKSKYFVQILRPEDEAGEECIVHAVREISPAEAIDVTFRPKAATLEDVWATIVFPAHSLAAGETFSRSFEYYVGPKKYNEINRYGAHQADVMEFGMWAPVGKILLKTLNWIHDKVWPHSYGLAIILLTIIIRILFWPVTHKSTVSMKRMQEIQPLVTEVRAQYKDNAQKQQQEIMKLYKEHKVNPLGGCLPMIIQIPVFIALFVVLRSAIELRYAPFLWIADLSQPENLFADVLPIPLNILPLIMAGTMVLQQRMTPTAGDPNQQKMMMFMPVMMLVIFYNFAAGLVLYWTTNQCLMIAQQFIMKRRSGGKPTIQGSKA